MWCICWTANDNKAKQRYSWTANDTATISNDKQREATIKKDKQRYSWSANDNKDKQFFDFS